MGVEGGVATIRAQMVWPMMIVLRASLGSNFEKFAKMAEIHIFANCLVQALKICHSNCHHRLDHLSPSCGHTTFHTHIT